MLTTEPQDLVLQFYKAFNDREIDRAIDLLALDCMGHLAGMPAPFDTWI